jgi:hypothetical protein
VTQVQDKFVDSKKVWVHPLWERSTIIVIIAIIYLIVHISRKY